ncbi:MAG: RNA polymerase sigma-70 factor [Muribaculaceae bacterium]|nr:RNA polymerase sigma-70 factor [Muribaculaceae bacterium]
MTVREFETHFRRLYLPLGMYAMRIVGDADDAEDLVEDTFVKVWQSVSSGMEVADFSAFMYRSVRNRCVSFLRSKVEHEDVSLIPDVSEEVIDTSRRDAAIWKAIDALPEKCREVFLMSKRDGYSNAEIADELGISIKTVKNQMTKAFSRLREVLTPHHKPFFLPFL